MKFRFHLLPHNDIRKNDEVSLQWKPFYSGSSKILSVLSNNAIYLLSFFIPVLLLFVLLGQHGFAPFGGKSLYILEGSQYLSLFATFVEQIQSGSFSFFASNGQIGNEYYSTVLFFFSSPLHLLLTAFPMQTAVYALHIVTVIRIGLSGLFMTYYLTHRMSGNRFSKYDFLTLLFSLGYSVSSYMLVQYNTFMYMDCAMLLPLLILGYEKLLAENNKKPFVLCLTYMFFSNYYITTVIVFFLFLYFFIEKKDNLHNACQLFFTLIKSVLCATALSAVTIVPGYYSFYLSKIRGSVWPISALIHDWASLFSKFMPNNYGSYVMTSVGGSNLYCGLFVLILLFFYFTDKKIALSRRVRSLLFLAVLFLFANVASFRYISSLFSEDMNAFNNFGFLICFFVLITASESLYHLKDNTFLRAVLSVSIPFALFLYATLRAKDYSNRDSLFTSLVFFVIYALLIIFYRINSINRKTYLALIMLFSVCELFGNASKNISYLSEDATPVSQTYEAAASGLVAGSFNPFDIDLGSETNLDFCSFLPGEYNAPKESGSTVFVQQNNIAASLGIDEPLFTDAALGISYECSENIICKQTPSNIFTVKVKPDTPNENTAYNRILLTITPDRNGDLYIYTNQLEHIGQVTAGVPFTHTMLFPTKKHLFQNYWIHGAYLSPETSALVKELSCDFAPPVKHNLTSFITEVTLPQDGTLLFNIPYTHLVDIMIDGEQAVLSKGTQGKTVLPATKGTHLIRISLNYSMFYIGLFISVLSLLLYCFRKKVFNIKYSFSFERLYSKVESYFLKHYVIIFAFAIPFFILLLACIIANISPFGVDSFFKNDGAALTIPSLYQSQEQLRNGSLLYSWTVGGGSNIFYTLPTMFLNFWLCLIPEAHLSAWLTVIEIIKIALCGVSMYLYLTRRKIGCRVHRSDYRILMFTTAYSLSAYMINMRGFFSWVDILFLFPLILLAMDCLMTKKRKSLYILLLTLAILINYNITLYVCIFLVVTFFTYHFESFKDFMCKGIRFALSSILAGGMSFFVLFSMYKGMQISPYSSGDSVFPTFTFYQSFFDSLKQSFFLAEPVNVTPSNGAINLYCGVFCILLTTLYILVAKRSKNKYIKLCFMLFVFFSSNNNMLSYVWNGFHYQSKVPNRYSFLVIFMLLDFSVEALYQLKKCSIKKLVAAFAGCITLCGLIILFANDTASAASIIGTLLLLTVFFILLEKIVKKKNKALACKRILVTVAIAELCINTWITLKSEVYSPLDSVQYNQAATALLKDEYLGDSLMDRIAYLGPVVLNQSMVNHVNALNQFNSYFTMYQKNLGASLGYGTSTNHIITDNNVTPFANSVTNVKYMVLDEYTLSEFIDFEHYTPIAFYNTSIILKNNHPLPIGYYMPFECAINVEAATEAEDFCNGVVQGYLPDKSLFTDTTEIYNVNRKEADPINNYVFSEGETATTFYQFVHFEPEKSGTYYLRTYEYFYLGYLEAGQAYDFKIEADSDESASVSRFHNDVFLDFYEKASKHPLEVSDYGDTYLNGTITMPQDGLLYLSIPYEGGWSAWIDGKKTNVAAFRDSTLCLIVPEGTHDIHLEFKPEGMTTGILVSSIFAFLYLLVIASELIQKRRSRKTASPDVN